MPGGDAREHDPRPALASRASTSAAAAKNAADHDECPLGNDGPSASAAGLNDGRTRSARCLIVVVMSPLPATTTSRNGTIQRLRVRIVSTIRERGRQHDDRASAGPTFVSALEDRRS